MAAGVAEDELSRQVKNMIRRDLKLGPTASIPDDMPFFGGDVDLDSLDMLLLVTSIEKEFGIKVPSEAVGREVFQNVSSLTQYIRAHRKPGHVAPSSAAAAPPAPSNPLDRLPHGEPFRFVTKITQHTPGQSATGTWAVTGAEPFFAGHFPGNPIVPGVLIAEALAQISGIAGPSTGSASEQGRLVHVDVRFEAPAAPPADIILTSRLSRVMGPLQQFDVSASVGDTVIARGSITLHRS